MHPEPLPPMYNHYTLDRRPLSHPNPLDRRPLSHPDPLDRRPLSHPETLDRRPLSHPDAPDRRLITQQVPLDWRPMAHPNPLDRRPLTQPVPLDRRPLAQTDPLDGLERRTIPLSDGSVRTYFALPPDPPPSARAPPVLSQLPLHQSQLPQPGLNSAPPHRQKDGERDGNVEKYHERSGAGPSGTKRKNEDKESHISKREKTVIVIAAKDKEKEKEKADKDKDKGKAPTEVDKKGVLEAFLKFSKLINENSSQKKNYLSTGRHGPLRCLVCGSDSKEFKDVKAMAMHTHYSMKLITEHRGLHRALCVLIGWDPNADPKNSRLYQQGLSVEQAQANRDDLILWPPTIVIQNTNSSIKKDGRVEGMGNREIDSKLLDLGFTGGKAKSLYGKEGHQGVTLVKFSDTSTGLKEAERLSEFFERTGQGRKNWEENKDNDSKLFDVTGKNKDLVKEYGSAEKRVLYGFIATASDLEIFDSDAKKRAVVKSRKESDLVK